MSIIKVKDLYSDGVWSVQMNLHPTYEYTDNNTVEKNMKKIILLVFAFMNSYKFHVYKLPKLS